MIHWLKMILVGIVGILVLAFVFSLVLSPVAHVEREGVIDARPEVIYQEIVNMHNLVHWIPWGDPDTGLQLTLSDPYSGPGARYAWTDPSHKIPDGYFRITGVDRNHSVHFRMNIRGIPPSTGSFQLALTLDGKHTWIKWILDTRVGWWPWWKFYGTMMDRLVGPSLENGLNRLKAICEKDDTYGILIREEKVPFRYVASVSDTIRQPSSILSGLEVQYARVRQFIRDKGLRITGHRLVQRTLLDSKTEIVNAGIPVDRPVPVTSGPRVLEMPQGNVLVGRYQGPLTRIQMAYDALHNYAKDHQKYSPAGPWEEWISDSLFLRDSSDRDWKVNVYLPVF